MAESLLVRFVLLPVLLAESQVVYSDAVFDVGQKTDVIYGQGLTCDEDRKTNCKAMDLLCDVYWPKAQSGGEPVPAQKPVYVIMHGGGNNGGSKGGLNVYVAKWWTARGFVVVDINYRLNGDYGNAPPPPTSDLVPPEELAEGWNKLYPAVRDAKAAIRFARSSDLVGLVGGIDASRIMSGGGSAGSIDMLGVGVTFEDDYKSEFTTAEDPTLLSTHLEQSSTVQANLLHWPSGSAGQLVQLTDPKNRSRYGPSNPPVIDFHGNKDETIDVSKSLELNATYDANGVPFDLHILDGCGHASWCYDGQGHCQCTDPGVSRNPTMEVLAFPKVAEFLKLEIVGPTPSLLSSPTPVLI